MRLSWFGAYAALLVVTACRSASAPVACTSSTPPASCTPTILVTNATCQPGPCISFALGGNIDKFVPVPEAGLLTIGWVRSRSACLRIPAADTQTVVHVGGAGQRDTLRTIWTLEDSLSLLATSGGGLVGSTSHFVPAAAAGWSVTFDGSGGVSPVLSSAPCTP